MVIMTVINCSQMHAVYRNVVLTSHYVSYYDHRYTCLLFWHLGVILQWIDYILQVQRKVSLVISPLLLGVATRGRRGRHEVQLVRRGTSFLRIIFLFSSSLLSSFLLPLFLCLVSFLLLTCASVYENTRSRFLQPY